MALFHVPIVLSVAAFVSPLQPSRLASRAHNNEPVGSELRGNRQQNSKSLQGRFYPSDWDGQTKDCAEHSGSVTSNLTVVQITGTGCWGYQ